jgi:hypothetical protein
VKGSVLAEVLEVVGVVCAALLLATEQSWGLYDWQVELPDASAPLGSNSASPTIMVAMRFMSRA